MAWEMDLARIGNLDSFRAYRWLTTIAEPDPKLYDYLRSNGVDLNHVINLLDGAVALCEWSLDGPKEDCILLPVMDENGVTPLDVVMFSMRDPSRIATIQSRNRAGRAPAGGHATFVEAEQVCSSRYVVRLLEMVCRHMSPLRSARSPIGIIFGFTHGDRYRACRGW
jgi:hypothetical protein